MIPLLLTLTAAAQDASLTVPFHTDPLPLIQVDTDYGRGTQPEQNGITLSMHARGQTGLLFARVDNDSPTEEWQITVTEPDPGGGTRTARTVELKGPQITAYALTGTQGTGLVLQVTVEAIAHRLCTHTYPGPTIDCVAQDFLQNTATY